LYLNDSAEFHHVRQLVNEWIKRTRSQNSIGFPEEYRLLHGRESVFVRFLERQLTSSKALNTFVVSFSEVHDDLSQWRAYAVGGGYSIGFAPSQVRGLGEKQGFKLVQCIYDHDEKARLIAELMEESLVRFNEISGRITDDDLTAGLGIYADLGPSPALTALGDEFFSRAQELASRIKDQAFEGEREWRLISVQVPTQLHFRNGSSMLIPYRIFELPPKPEALSVREIVAGPSPHIFLNLSAVAALCRTHNVDCERISKSRVPYRDW
jgi:hypothetical protein